MRSRGTRERRLRRWRTPGPARTAPPTASWDGRCNAAVCGGSQRSGSVPGPQGHLHASQQGPAAGDDEERHRPAAAVAECTEAFQDFQITRWARTRSTPAASSWTSRSGAEDHEHGGAGGAHSEPVTAVSAR